MAGEFDLPLSAQSSANTGTPSADVFKGLPSTLLIVPVDTVISDSDIANLETYLNNKTVATTDLRFYPLSSIIGNEDITVEAVVAESGYGVPTQEKKALPGYTFQFRAGEGLGNNLNVFNDQTKGVFIIDDNNQIWGSKVSGGCKAYTMYCRTQSAGFKDGANGKYYLFTVSALKGTEWESSRSIYDADVDPNNITGILDLAFDVTDVSSYTITAKIQENISKVDVGATYETEFETVGKFTAIDTSDGSEVTITSSTYDSATSTFAFLLDLSAPTTVKLSGQLASAWYTDLSAKYEFIPTTQNVTA